MMHIIWQAAAHFHRWPLGALHEIAWHLPVFTKIKFSRTMLQSDMIGRLISGEHRQTDWTVSAEWWSLHYRRCLLALNSVNIVTLTLTVTIELNAVWQAPVRCLLGLGVQRPESRTKDHLLKCALIWSLSRPDLRSDHFDVFGIFA